MNKRTIICIACIVGVLLIIAFAVFFAKLDKKSITPKPESKIVITKYDENFNISKTIEVTDKNKKNEINKMLENPSLEENEESKYLAIRNDVKVAHSNGKYFMIQLDLPEYCYYEDPSSDTKIVIKMPEGLLDEVKTILGEND